MTPPSTRASFSACDIWASSAVARVSAVGVGGIGWVGVVVTDPPQPAKVIAAIKADALQMTLRIGLTGRDTGLKAEQCGRVFTYVASEYEIEVRNILALYKTIEPAFIFATASAVLCAPGCARTREFNQEPVWRRIEKWYIIAV